MARNRNVQVIFWVSEAEKRPSVLEKIQKNKTAIQAKTAEKKLLGQER